MATQLTREVLFQKVWERPMTKVAADYGISDVALKKIVVIRAGRDPDAQQRRFTALDDFGEVANIPFMGESS